MRHGNLVRRAEDSEPIGAKGHVATKADVTQLETQLIHWTIAAMGMSGLVGGRIGSLAK